MRILGACISSKCFGKKIKKMKPLSNYCEKKRRMRILSARIFSKFFGGKIKFF